MILRSGLVVMFAVGAQPAFAAAAEAAATVGAAAAEAAAIGPAPGDADHDLAPAEILVTAPYRRDRYVLPTAVGVVQGDVLLREVRSTIGETLARQPGVSATFFGPNASRPILRGLDAERVRVLTDGIGSFDVSNTSVDHAVAINPLLAERVEIVRGPAALLFGSSAIGGVVNIQDRRIPRSRSDEAVHLDAIGNYGSNADERALAGAVDVAVGKTGLIVHADGSFLETGDYRGGGFVYSLPLRDAANAIGGDIAEDANQRGRVDNSSSRTWTVGGGLAWVSENGGSLGFAISHIDSNYGIPNGLELGDEDHAHEGGDHEGEEGHGHADIRIALRQTRLDGRAIVPMQGWFEQARLRFGYADYRHDELESDGAIGTTFLNQGLEGRFELVQTPRDNWKGAIGMQYFARRFESFGEEAYVPLNNTQQVGLFTLQSFDLGRVAVEVGARYEHSDVNAPLLGITRNFDSFSGSIGASVPLADWLRFAVSYAHSERAPSAEELFADGAHAATRAFEIGNPNFTKERSDGIEAVLRGRGSDWRFELSGYFTRFNNFIYLTPTGAEEDGLPVFRYFQADARYWGAEAEAAFTVARFGETRVEVTALADYVNAAVLAGAGPAPRIPPFRILGGVEASGGRFGGRIEVERAIAQNRLASFETRTPGYTLVNASVTWKPFGAANPTAVLVSANNIFDVEARRHASFLKDSAPLPGRDIRVTLRFTL